ncbi:uncharacterized protein [Bemisia tabaci]|uniref:uncharacterized protein isoform X2 n=1 Tax=Bemisia tabaci TaxID=7038 RepID=UPI003B2894DC
MDEEEEAFTHLVFFAEEGDESRPRETEAEQEGGDDSEPTIITVQADVHEPPETSIVKERKYDSNKTSKTKDKMEDLGNVHPKITTKETKDCDDPEIMPAPLPESSSTKIPAPRPGSSSTKIPSPRPGSSSTKIPSPRPGSSSTKIPSPRPGSSSTKIPAPRPGSSSTKIPSPRPGSSSTKIPAPRPGSSSTKIPSPRPGSSSTKIPAPLPGSSSTKKLGITSAAKKFTKTTSKPKIQTTMKSFTFSTSSPSSSKLSCSSPVNSANPQKGTESKRKNPFDDSQDDIIKAINLDEDTPDTPPLTVRSHPSKIPKLDGKKVDKPACHEPLKDNSPENQPEMSETDKERISSPPISNEGVNPEEFDTLSPSEETPLPNESEEELVAESSSEEESSEGDSSVDSNDSNSTIRNRSKRKKRKTKKQSRTKKRKGIRHKYRSAWEADDRFKDWIRKSSKGQRHFYCLPCNQHYSCQGGTSVVDKHDKSAKHCSNLESIKNVADVFPTKKKIDTSSKERKIKEAEIRMCLFMGEHNISFNSADHLVSLIKAVAPVANEMTCNRTKCTQILKNVIATDTVESLIEQLKADDFALILDESTDRTDKKNLGLVTRYVTKDLRVIDQFLALLPCPDATAAGLHKTITDYFKENDIPYRKNMVGLGSDGPNVMTGVHKGLHKLFKDEIPHLFSLKCTCHSLAIVASNACEELPKEVEALLREAYGYLQHSCKRLIKVKEFQDFVGVKPHKILKFFDVRWLSLERCVDRFLEQWSALRLFFQSEVLEEKSEAAKPILQKFNAVNKLYLMFLKSTLPLLTDLNLEFQSERPKVHKIYSSVTTLYELILSFYMKPEHLAKNDVETYKYKDPQYFKPLKDIFVGGEANAALSNQNKNLPSDLLQGFRTKCLNFYVKLCSEIQRVFPFNSNEMKVSKSFSFLKPQNIQGINSISSAASFTFTNHLNIDFTKIDLEFLKLKRLEVFNEEKFHEMPLLAFWQKVALLKKGDNSEAFPLINKLVRYILTLPHSSAAVERIFSAVNLNVTKLRNQLDTDTTDAIIQAKAYIKINQAACYNVPVPISMIDRHNKNMYDPKVP